MRIRKVYVVHVYDQDGATPLGTLTTERPDASLPFLRNPVTFNSQINGGLGQCLLDVFAPFDDFDETLINFMNVCTIDAVVIDEDLKTQTVTQIYKGFMSRIEPYVEGGDEGVRVTLLGLVSLLTLSYYGTSPDYEVTQTNKDPEFIAKAVIDNFNSAFGGSLLGYSGSTSTVGTNVTYTYTQQTWLQALQKTVELAEDDWWFGVRADGKLYLQAKPGSATHTFTIGRDLVNLSAIKDSEKVKNEVIVIRSGGTKSTYTDATSQSTYGTGSPATGRRTEIVSDSAIPNSGTADQRGNKALNDQKDFKVATKLTINSQYAIESIYPGQTCRLMNFDGSSTNFNTNMMITAVNYLGDAAVLDLEEKSLSFGRTLENFVNG